MNYINIHRHGPAKAEEWAIQNIHNNFENPPGLPFSAGIHPWYISDDWKNELSLLEKIASDKMFLAVGECGLDSMRHSVDVPLQEQVFQAQIKLANKLKKPLIIHSVKTADRIMHLLHENNNQVPVIFHGFSSSAEMANRIIKKGYYLSLGKAVQKEKIKSYLPQLPIARIFLETDDNEITIEEIYHLVAGIKNIPEMQLNLQLQQNLQKVFNIVL